MPNRIVKESILTSDTINSLSDFEFRLWVGLIVSVDDAGRGDARPAIIKGRVFPLRDRVTVKDISAALHGLAAKGCVSLYEVDGKPYFWFPTWKDHQRIRDCKPKYPEPPAFDNLPQTAASCGELPQIAARIQYESESNTNPNPNTNTKEKRANAFVPPTLEEVIEYCRERGSSVDPKQFYEYFQAGNWTDSKGQKVKNWKQKLLTWEKYQPPKKQTSGREALEEIYAEAKAAEERGALPEWALPK